MDSSVDVDHARAAAVVEAYGRWLHKFNWGWWCHLTFRTPPSLDRALLTFRTWLRDINYQVFGRNYYKYHLGARWVYGMEYQRRGAIHFHVLIADCAHLPIEAAQQAWKRFSRGGDAKIELYTRSKGATYYLAKVYYDHQAGEIDFGGRWPAGTKHFVDTTPSEDS